MMSTAMAMSLLRDELFQVADDKWLKSPMNGCKECGGELFDTHNIKLMNPPIAIYGCPKCKLEYWYQEALS